MVYQWESRIFSALEKGFGFDLKLFFVVMVDRLLFSYSRPNHNLETQQFGPSSPGKLFSTQNHAELVCAYLRASTRRFIRQSGLRYMSTPQFLHPAGASAAADLRQTLRSAITGRTTASAPIFVASPHCSTSACPSQSSNPQVDERPLILVKHCQKMDWVSKNIHRDESVEHMVIHLPIQGYIF